LREKREREKREREERERDRAEREERESAPKTFKMRQFLALYLFVAAYGFKTNLDSYKHLISEPIETMNGSLENEDLSVENKDDASSDFKYAENEVENAIANDTVHFRKILKKLSIIKLKAEVLKLMGIIAVMSIQLKVKKAEAFKLKKIVAVKGIQLTIKTAEKKVAKLEVKKLKKEVKLLKKEVKKLKLQFPPFAVPVPLTPATTSINILPGLPVTPEAMASLTIPALLAVAFVLVGIVGIGG
jgi:hypothetical protein